MRITVNPLVFEGLQNMSILFGFKKSRKTEVYVRSLNFIQLSKKNKHLMWMLNLSKQLQFLQKQDLKIVKFFKKNFKQTSQNICRTFIGFRGCIVFHTKFFFLKMYMPRLFFQLQVKKNVTKTAPQM